MWVGVGGGGSWAAAADLVVGWIGLRRELLTHSMWGII
jgi:hypothetical protein